MQTPETHHVVINFRRPIALFPLPGAVLLPHTLMPLHIFEPRYRKLARDVIDSTGLIAIATFDSQPSEEEYTHGTPSLRPHVCIGYAQQYEQIEDGRFLILLQGLCRARIKNEVDHTPYRMALLEPTEPQPATDDQLRVERDRLQNLLQDPAFEQLQPLTQIRRLIDLPIPTAAIVDLTIAQLCRDPEQRYVMLVQPDARQRAAWLNLNFHQLAESAIQHRAEAGIDDDPDDDFPNSLEWADDDPSWS